MHLVPSGGVAAPSPLVPARGTSARQTIRVGLVGCGAFARFSMAQYRQLAGVTIGAVADVDPAAARRAADELRTEPRAPEALLTAPDIDLVYIATPPALHHPQAAAALRAGKHVLVEKPLATSLADAEDLESLAARGGLVCVANLIERYDPLAHAVHRIIESRILGGMIHGLFMNEAADEGLGRGHWFWDRATSGGIFVEHGVHFFDLVASWLGPGTVVAAARSVRPTDEAASDHAAGGAPAVEEQVSCTCRYRVNSHGGPGRVPRPHMAADRHAGILFHFEHGFHQPSRLDRQEIRLVFERGEVRLFDWVPTHGEVRGLLDDDAAAAVAGMLPRSTVRSIDRYAGATRRCRGRFRDFEAAGLVEITFSLGLEKLQVYGEVVRDLAADQLARIRDPAHVRRLTEADSVAAVALACEADRMALAAG
jgi:predicted dehydrogenase